MAVPNLVLALSMSPFLSHTDINYISHVSFNLVLCLIKVSLCSIIFSLLSCTFHNNQTEEGVGGDMSKIVYMICIWKM